MPSPLPSDPAPKHNLAVVRPRWSGTRGAFAALALALAALLALQALMFRNAYRVNDAGQSVTRAEERLRALAETLSDLQLAEAAQRNHLITGHPDDLGQFEQARVQVAAKLDRLEQLAEGEPDRAQIQQLRQVALRRLGLLDEGLRAYRHDGFPAAAAVVAGHHGRALMEQVRQLTAAVERAQRELLDRHMDAARAQARERTVLLATLTVVELLLVIAACVAVYRRALREARARMAELQRQAAAELQARLAAVVESSEDAIITKSLDGIITTWNVGAQRLFGYTAADAIGRPVTFLMPPDRQAEEPAILERIRRGQRVEAFETVRVTKDGRRVHASIAISPLRDADGRVIGASKIARDVTRLKAAERAVRESEARVLAIVNTAAEGIVSMDEAGTIDFANGAARAMFGYAEGRLRGKRLSELVSDRGDPDARGELRPGRLLGGRRELLASRADGTTFTAELSVAPVPQVGLDGAICFVGVLSDVTARKEYEAEVLRLNRELRRKVAELEALFSVIPLGVGVADDPECHRIRANPVLARLLGTPHLGNAGTDDGESNATAAPSRLTRNGRGLEPSDLPIQVAARTGEPVDNSSIDVTWPDGRVTPLSASAAPLFDADGKVRGAVGVFWDVSEMRRAEALRIAKEAAEAANRAKDDFLANVSHDLRTPIGAIRLISELLRRGSLSPDQRDLVDQIEAAAVGQRRLIEDILDATRIMHGKLRVDRRPIDLAAAARAAVRAVTPAADDQCVSLQLEIEPPDLPVSVRGDDIRLQQVLWNLLSNAIKFSRRDAPVRVRLFRDGDHAVVQVIDRGEGITPEFLPRVFDRHAQAPGADRRFRGGLGLGLSIARHIVEAHDGSIRAESAGAGHGATFTVTLPLDENSVSSARDYLGATAAH